jgi:subtilisin family serine protease
MIKRAIGIVCVSSLFALGQSYAKSYKINIYYKNLTAHSIGHSALYSVGNQVSSSASNLTQLDIDLSPQLEQEIDNYVKNNVYVSSDEYIRIYGASPEAFRLARIIAKQNPNIKYALPSGSKSRLFNNVSNDPDEYIGTNVTQWFRQAWDMGPSTGSTYGIDAPGAWAFITNRPLSTAYVAVIDDGIAPNAPYDIRSRISYANTYNFYDDDGEENVQINKNIYVDTVFHGTHVAGTVIANGPNVTGVVGLVSEAKAYVLRAIGNGGSDAATAVAELWAVNQHKNPAVLAEMPYLANMINNPYPAKILNQSYGASRYDDDGDPTMSLDAWVENHFISSCELAGDVNELINATGAIQVMAAGNDGHALINDTASGCPNINAIVVESTQPNGQLAWYSTRYDAEAVALYNQYAEILLEELGAVQPQSLIVRAPGGDTSQQLPGIDGESAGVYSTLNCPTAAGSVSPTPDENLDCYGYYQGTSMAAPHVSGIAALIYTLEPGANYNYVASILSQSKNSANIVDARLAVQNVVASQQNNSSDDDSGLSDGAITAISIGGGYFASFWLSAVFPLLFLV